MSFKDRMKVWQQVTSPKSNYVPSPPFIPKTVTVQPKPVETAQPAPQQPVAPPQQSVTLNNVEKAQPFSSNVVAPAPSVSSPPKPVSVES